MTLLPYIIVDNILILSTVIRRRVTLLTSFENSKAVGVNISTHVIKFYDVMMTIRFLMIHTGSLGSMVRWNHT